MKLWLVGYKCNVVSRHPAHLLLNICCYVMCIKCICIILICKMYSMEDNILKSVCVLECSHVCICKTHILFLTYFHIIF